MADYEVFEIPGFTSQSGITFDARLAYKTYGTLSPRRDNVIVIPTFYGGRHKETEYLLGEGCAIDPTKYFVVIPNMFGNGLSSSPSNMPAPNGRGGFPTLTLYDNVTCQHKLLTEHLGATRVRLVAGFSMGGQQAYQWGVLYPGLVDAIAPICAAAKISVHNYLFVDSIQAALKLDPIFNDGWYETQPVRGILAFARIYAGWLFSQDFFREGTYREIGLASMEDVVRFTQNYFLQNDANDLLAMARTWQAADVSANPLFNGDFKRALGNIRSRAIVMPGETDLYFRVRDNELEVAAMPKAELRPIPSVWGHAAGFGANATDSAFINTALRELLAA